MNIKELKAAKERARFYAEHPKETADLWTALIKNLLNPQDTCTNRVMSSIFSKPRYHAR